METPDSNHKKRFSLSSIKKHLSTAIIIFLAVIGIPVTVAAVKTYQDVRSRAEGPKNVIQMGTFNPVTVEARRLALIGFEQKTQIPHVPGEIIIKFRNNVLITTSSSISQNVDSFTVGDIISGLPQEEIDRLNQINVTSIKKMFPNAPPPDPFSESSANPISNIYMLTIPNDADLAQAMIEVCEYKTIVEYCEPDYQVTSSTLLINFLIPKIYAAPAQQNFNQPIVALIDGSSSHSQQVALAALSQNQNIQITTTSLFDGDEGTFYMTDLANAIYNSVDSGASVINISLVAQIPSGQSSQTFDNAVQYAIDNNVVIVAAAGNTYGTDESTYAGTPVTNVITANPNVISVGALQGNTIAPISYAGPNVDVVANGASADGRFGTSTASPRVAALIAQMVNPNLTPQQIMNIITSTSTDLGQSGKDPNYGFGSINPQSALTQANSLLQNNSAQNQNINTVSSQQNQQQSQNSVSQQTARSDSNENYWDNSLGVWISPDKNTFDPDQGFWRSEDGTLGYDSGTGEWMPVGQLQLKLADRANQSQTVNSQTAITNTTTTTQPANTNSAINDIVNYFKSWIPNY